MAGQGPTSLAIEGVLFHPTTSLGDIERQFAGAEGYLGAKISHTHLDNAARILQDFVFEFSTASDAAKALQAQPNVTVNTRTYPVVPHGGDFGDPQYHVGDIERAPILRSKKRAKKDETSGKLQCKICFTDLEGAYSVPCRRCKAPRCHDCLERDFKVSMTDMDRMPVKCCTTVMHHEVAKGILPPAEIEAYKSKFDEMNTIDPLYCPVPTCSTFIPPRMFTQGDSKVTCPVCDTRICTKCKQLAAQEHTCSENDERHFILKTFDYKTCPKCGTGVAKMFGCPHASRDGGIHSDEGDENDSDSETGVVNLQEEQGTSEATSSRQDSAPERQSMAILDDIDSNNADHERTVNEEVSTQRRSSPMLAVVAETGILMDVSNVLARPPSDGNPGFSALLTAIAMQTSEARTVDGGVMSVGEAQMVEMDAPGRSTTELSTVIAGDPEILTANSTETQAVEAQTNGTGTQEESDTNTGAQNTTTTAEAPNTAQPANLDDLETYDWEAMSFDFGEEPTDETWDVWGCRHRFANFTAAAIPKFWIVGVDPAKSENIEVECMACFRKTKVWESGKAPLGGQASAEIKISKSECSFECKLCGVIYCGSCKNAVRKRIKKERNAGGVV
ncbi:hypothetical protein LTR99_007860 [Exophiala xenobiotica]|uniref:IBR domain-containing protein n=1 Tax=Vermiconidia calcicola TaxID=1690605 RepID=A0AAV9Q3N1_9PEZI|nr:hypothetical protein LTR72_005223 [Exophiala xenobiotica]KAK5534766.1 hypothetical protein LTR23_008697 [Chaetothyriales sp. CCFEE 6169]KAK5535171.1 hypothetical protein LTR25_006179 [Vermiconidia calcicola]KAK5273571.1 hypothetical protein LTR96_000171 [Exophiala xenobiotica]KAK5289238.1 hypothetical protein LTR14_007489 [Exophiala xenobiotica]